MEYHVTPHKCHIYLECTYTEDTYTPHSNWQYIYEILLHQTGVTYSPMHIYWGYIYAPNSNLQHTYGIMLHQMCYIYHRMHIYWGYIYPHSYWQFIYEYCYTKQVSHKAQCTYTEDTFTPQTPIYNTPME